MKIAIGQINPTVGDLKNNAKKIVDYTLKAKADIIIFPELALTGYPLDDLVENPAFLASVERYNAEIIAQTKNLDCLIIFGTVRTSKSRIFNSAFLVYKGQVVQIVDKKSLPNYGVFDEKRNFAMHSCNNIYEHKGVKLLILICEDIWHKSTYENYTKGSCDLILTLNASPFVAGKFAEREKVVRQLVEHFDRKAVYVNIIGAQDEIAFDGASFAMNTDFGINSLCLSWEEDLKLVSDTTNNYNDSLEQIYNALILGLRDYITKSGFKEVILGLSGGIDSALVATIAADALSPKNVIGVRLPSKYSSQHSLQDAATLAEKLGIRLNTIHIENAVETLLTTVSPYFESETPDTTEENLQSRTRGIILMALSNKNGALLLSTGNKSEYATGYATLYGDMCGAFAPIKDVYKTLVFELAKWRNQNIPQISLFKELEVIPENSITKPPSAELRHDQKDSDSLPEYEILDSILYALIEQDIDPAILMRTHDNELIRKVLRLIKASEFKRKQAPPGTIITLKSFVKGRRMPIVNKYGYEIL